MANVVDLNNIKENIRALLLTNNTTSSSVRDLSSGIAGKRRVQNIVKWNIERLPMQASWFPAITIWIDRKAVAPASMGPSRLQAVDMARVEVKVAGIVYNPNLVSNKEDPADEDLENLMENIEYILRSDPRLTNKATRTRITDVTYHSGIMSKESHVRVGILTLEAAINY